MADNVVHMRAWAADRPSGTGVDGRAVRNDLAAGAEKSTYGDPCSGVADHHTSNGWAASKAAPLSFAQGRRRRLAATKLRSAPVAPPEYDDAA